MNRDDVMRMAREAGGDDWGIFRDFMPEIECFAALAYEAGRADENEACAQIAAYLLKMPENDISAMIRRRKE